MCIGALRITLEQVTEMREEVHVNFIDFMKAFDSLDRAKMWWILTLHGIPEKYLNT